MAREAAWRDAGEADLANECANIASKIRTGRYLERKP